MPQRVFPQLSDPSKRPDSRLGSNVAIIQRRSRAQGKKNISHPRPVVADPYSFH